MVSPFNFLFLQYINCRDLYPFLCSVPCDKYKYSVKVPKIMLILDLIIEIQTCSERFYVRADTKEGAEEWIRTLRKAAVSLIDVQICPGQVLNVTVMI